MSNSNLAASPMENSPCSIGRMSQITGIPETTLRVWERRYQFPHSTRSPGGHRQYSQQELLRVRWVKMQMDAGMRAGRAIRARALMAQDAAVINALREPLPPASLPDPVASGTRNLLLKALLAYDSAGAADLLDRLGAQHSVPSMVLDLVGPTLSAIGAAWANGEADIATEHYATNCLRHQLLKWMQASPAPHAVRPIVLACAPGELHEGSLLMLGVLVRQLRWPVLYLGQSLPLSDLGTLVQDAQPALIVFAAMGEAAALALAEWPLWLRAHSEPQLPIIGYGGRAFSENPTLAERVPGVLLGATLDEGCQRINRIMLHLAVLVK